MKTRSADKAERLVSVPQETFAGVGRDAPIPDQIPEKRLRRNTSFAGPHRETRVCCRRWGQSAVIPPSTARMQPVI